MAYMKILFVSSGNRLTSSSNLAKMQAESLIAKDIKVDMFYIKGRGIIGYLRNLIPLRRTIVSNNYDIVHAHYGISGCVALIAKNKSTKVVISYMGNDLLGDHANNGESTFYGDLLVRLNLMCSGFADFLIVKSNEMSHKLKQNNKSILPNGVNLNKFYSVDRKLAIKKTGWDPNLRHILFLSDPERPEKNFNLIKPIFDQRKIEKAQLHFLKNIPEYLLVDYYNASDVCILTSFHEGSPNVVKEAMACNRPIVCTDVGDVKWIFGDTSGCYLCKFDTTDLIRKIELALSFARSFNHTEGRARILSLGLDSETIAEKLIGVYREVLNHKSSI